MLHAPNSNGFKDFCVKSLKGAAVGRKEIKIAEQGKLVSVHLLVLQLQCVDIQVHVMCMCRNMTVLNAH